jgi:hypothetical protein
LCEKGTNALEEWLDLEDTIDNVPRVRLAHPYTSIGFEGTRKRRREAMGSYKWSVGDRVDAFFHDRYVPVCFVMSFHVLLFILLGRGWRSQVARRGNQRDSRRW